MFGEGNFFSLGFWWGFWVEISFFEEVFVLVECFGREGDWNVLLGVFEGYGVDDVWVVVFFFVVCYWDWNDYVVFGEFFEGV